VWLSPEEKSYSDHVTACGDPVTAYGDRVASAGGESLAASQGVFTISIAGSIVNDSRACAARTAASASPVEPARAKMNPR
jgi:hypothetical protein